MQCLYGTAALLFAGTGHIRFWSMARTFTGLKLQGSIGKFGNEELSDVSGYTQMPDGKVSLCSQSRPASHSRLNLALSQQTR